MAIHRNLLWVSVLVVGFSACADGILLDAASISVEEDEDGPWQVNGSRDFDRNLVTVDGHQKASHKKGTTPRRKDSYVKLEGETSAVHFVEDPNNRGFDVGLQDIEGRGNKREEKDFGNNDPYTHASGVYGQSVFKNDVWNVIKDVKRHGHKVQPDEWQVVGPKAFFASSSFFEWMLFALALAIFFPLFYYISEWESTTSHHALGALIWLGLGICFNLAVAARLGTEDGVMWFTGYLLELIFSIENVFIFHIVTKAFRAPKRVTKKALFVVVCCQIVFEMVFFMGLANKVREMQALPYLLGLWLLYVGYNAGAEEGHDQFNVRDHSVFKVSEVMLGRRLTLTYEECDSVFLIKGGRMCVTLVFPFICCMLAVDFFLEVDVTLTKIEELPNQYIAFTSSALAAFAVPELFFVASDMFHRYPLLKYGISFVLVFFGVQMLLHRLFSVPDLVGCGIIIVVMIVCIMASDVQTTENEAGLKKVSSFLKPFQYSPSGLLEPELEPEILSSPLGAFARDHSTKSSSSNSKGEAFEGPVSAGAA